MKKAFVIFCIMTMAVFSILCGCGKKKEEGSNAAETTAVNLAESQYVGNWEAVKAEFKGEEQDVNEVIEGGLFLTLNADGTSVISSEGEETRSTWTETAEGVVLKGEKVDMKFKNVDGQLVYELFGVNIFLVKQ